MVIIKTETIEDGKEYHDVFTYDNGYILDTWYENHPDCGGTYIGVLNHPSEKKLKDRLEYPTMYEPRAGKDILDFGALLNMAEDKMI